MKRAIYACDVGSTRVQSDGRPSFAWARVDPDDSGLRVVGSRQIRELTGCVGEDLRSGASVALGFEAPLFVPVPDDARRLSAGRTNEGSRSFAAPIGG
jgi:hypothetical protein